MQRQFLLLWVLCALATARPRGKELVKIESKEHENWASNSATTLSYLFPSTKSSLMTTTNSPTTNTTVTTTSTTTTFPATSTSLSTTTSSTTNLPLTTTTGATTSISVAISTTVKSKSKVVSIKHADNLTTAISNAGDKLVVIFVMTTWCPLSLRVVPTVEELSNRTENTIFLKVVFNKIDTSEDWKYGVTGVSEVPTFMFLKKGIKLEEYASANAERLKAKVIKNSISRV